MCARAQVLAAQSGKMRLLDRLLKQLQARGHKVLIFSQVRLSSEQPLADTVYLQCTLPSATCVSPTNVREATTTRSHKLLLLQMHR
jgi:hypothetical protein